MEKKTIKSLVVEAKRWFNGNTYHAVKIVLTTTDNQNFEIHSKVYYGYGNHFLMTAKNLLKAQGFERPESVPVNYDVLDVARKKDLKHFVGTALLENLTVIIEE